MQSVYRRQSEHGCVVCRRYGLTQKTRTEIHHLRASMGMSQRNVKCIPLCTEHHRGNTGFHGMGRRSFEKMFCSELELLKWYEQETGDVVDWTIFEK